jgi:hypothetical protein
MTKLDLIYHIIKLGFMKNKKLKTIPKFKNENEERKFWLTHDSTEYVDWKKR